METMTEVQVEELWTNTVNITPIISPTTGFVRSGLLWKIVPEKNILYSHPQGVLSNSRPSQIQGTELSPPLSQEQKY